MASPCQRTARRGSGPRGGPLHPGWRRPGGPVRPRADAAAAAGTAGSGSRRLPRKGPAVTTTAHDADPRLTDPTHDLRPTSRRAVLPAATAYVAAWLAGLAVLPEAVDAHAGSAGPSARYLVAHAGAAVLQSWLVHGVAAVALVWFVRSALAAAGAVGDARPPALHRLTLWAVLGGGCGVPAAGRLPPRAVAPRRGPPGPRQAPGGFHAVNGTDVVKLAPARGRRSPGPCARPGLGRGAGRPASGVVHLARDGLAVDLPVAGLAFVSTAPPGSVGCSPCRWSCC